MKESNLNQTTKRRGFLGILASGAAAIGLASIASPFKVNAQQQAAPNAPKPMSPNGAPQSIHPADQWFNKVKGRHRVVYDSTKPNEVMPFVWPAVFLMTNAATGTPASDCGVVVVMRHEGIPFAFQDKMWEKYNFSEFFKAGEMGPMFQAADAKTAAKTRNPMLNTKHGDFVAPGLGAVDIGIKDLQASGVMFCVCNAAMTVFSAIVADQMKMKHEDVLKEWTDNVIPGFQIVPSGVWAVGRAQEHGCKYIFAG
jgi:intracellular sulfur oxidation DsrE/DsrF family protein